MSVGMIPTCLQNFKLAGVESGSKFKLEQQTGCNLNILNQVGSALRNKVGRLGPQAPHPSFSQRVDY